jgi:glutathione S-transferase
MGFDISVYPNLSKWLENCKSLPGYDENEEGASQFGQGFKSKASI